MYHWGLWPIIVCSNNDPMLTLTYFSTRFKLVARVFEWGKQAVTPQSFNAHKKTQQMTKSTEDLYLIKKQFGPEWVVCPCLGAVYMYKTLTFKQHLFQIRSTNQTQMTRGASMSPRPSSPVRHHFFGHICYPLYHFFAASAAPVLLTCDLIPSNHQKCRVLLIRISLTHVVACVINRHSQGVKTIRPGVTSLGKQCKYYNDTCLIKVVIVKGIF